MLSQTAILKDDVAEIMAKVKESEVVVFATPIYYYEMCGQMKTLLDRLNPLYESDYKFRDIYMLATAADDDAHVIDKAYNGLQGWGDCLKAMCSATVLLSRVMQRIILRLCWMLIISANPCEA